MRELEPVLLNAKLINELANNILEYYKQELYNPIVEVINQETKKIIIKNSLEGDLLLLLKQKKIIIKNNYIIGKLNSKISRAIEKAGGIYKKQRKAYYLPIIPLEVQKYIDDNDKKANKLINAILLKLDNPPEKEINKHGISFLNIIASIIFQLYDNVGVATKVKKITGLKSLEQIIKPEPTKGVKPTIIKPEQQQIKLKPITEQEKQAINTKYVNNLDLPIKNWKDENIKKMRQDLQSMILEQGKTVDEVTDYIEKNYDVCKDKAIFLARQETSLLLTHYTVEKYKEAGIRKFKWETRGDDRVRESHRNFNGKEYYFDSPPEVNGKPLLPGEDYNCRCVMIPIIE